MFDKLGLGQPLVCASTRLAPMVSLLVVCCASINAQSFNFQGAVPYQAQNGAVAAATADFNADGHVDIALANAASSSVSIYLGKADGTFTPSTIAVPGGCLVGFVATGDFNRDGKSDVLAACQFQSTVWVLPGMGNGQFGTPVSTTLPGIAWFGFTGVNAQDIAVADFNNDGATDLVIGLTNSSGDPSSLSINLMIANGDGTFQAPSAIVSAGAFAASTVMVADFNRDGSQDVAVAGTLSSDQTPAIEIFAGTGKGAFQAGNKLNIPVVPAYGFGIVADINQDGIPDLIVAGRPADTTNQISQLCVYTGDGAGGFKQAFSAQEGAGHFILGLLAASVRGAGTLDLIEEVGSLDTSGASTSSFSLTARAGNGDGTFQAPVSLSFPFGQEPIMYGMMAGDWNGDGLTDLAFAALPSFANLTNHSTGNALQDAIKGDQSLPPGSLMVLLNGNTATSVLSISSSRVQFSSIAGGSAPAAQSVTLSNSGTGGALTWTASSNASWLQLSSSTGSTPATLSISTSPGSLAPGTYLGAVQVSAAGAAGSPQAIAVTLVISAISTGPAITGVVNGASFQPGIESGSWVSILGSNLAPDARPWQPSDFQGSKLPQSLDGVSVTIDGKSAAISYISDKQINLQAPDDPVTGPVAVVVTNNGQKSAAFTAQLQTYAPAFFLYSGAPYAIATHLDYSLVGNPAVISGTAAAKPGDILVLWGTGFGPTSPPTAAGATVSGDPAVAILPAVTVGGTPVKVLNTVLTPDSAGLYQVAIQLPDNVPSGAVEIRASVGGVQAPSGVLMFIAGQ